MENLFRSCVALWCADKRLFARARGTRAVVFLQFCDRSQCCDLMTSHTFRKLGSGAMGSRFREQLTHWTAPAVFTQPDQWKEFLSAMVIAHEADLFYMRNFLEEITKNKYNQGGLTLKDLKPYTFVLPSVVRRVLIVGRTDSPRFRNDVEMGCTDARIGQGQVHFRSSARLSMGN